MRLALISDIHGNLVALETVLAALANERADQILCLGDVAASGPQPRAAIERLRAMRIPCVLGNADVELFALDALTADSDFMRIIKDISVWNAAQLAPADFDFLRAFQPTITVSLGDDVTLLCYHGSPQSNTDIITTTTPDDDLARMVSGVHTTLLAGGHTHTQMLRRYRQQIIINPGSVGLPYEYVSADRARNVPWAEYAVVTCNQGNVSVDFRRVPLDVNAVVRAARASGMPHAEWWASEWVNM